MKTGRVRKKAEPTTPPGEEAGAATPAPKPKSPPPTTPTLPAGTTVKQPKPPYLIFGILGAVFVCFVIVMIVMTLRGGADEWVEVTRANGSWTTTITVLGPQVKVEERWEADCTGDANGTVRVGTCIMKDTDTYQDKVVDDYEEYAYDIYYEETWDKTYQAQGTEFVVTALGGDDWWEGHLHYTLAEELDRDSCQYTDYTLWVDDPKDTSQEVEVYLAECEVWDHVVVAERVYDQRSWCQCDVTTLVEMGQQSEQGSGSNVLWPNPNVPRGGSMERAFKGQVTFLGDDYTYTTTTDDLAQYQDYLTTQYFIGLNDGKPVTVSKNPKD
jgi:hypothetical protein